MYIDIGLDLGDGASAAEQARSAERAGFAAFQVSETRHDPFLILAEAAAATERIELATAVAIAFARSPMTLAQTAYDLQRISGGRLTLGLGSQIRPHIENRFSMPWGAPVTRMREYVSALRAIWACWHDGADLNFEGRYYRHTLMTPMFAPPRHEFGPPPVLVAAVGEKMTEVAGEVADGLVCHAFTTPDYLRERTLPALARGADRADRDPGRLTVGGLVMMAIADTEAELETARTATRRQVAFYASTPAYRPVLDLHGLGDLQPRLRELSKRGAWAEMGDAIDDDVLALFAATGTPEEVHALVRDRYTGLLDRATVYAPHPPSPAAVRRFLELTNGDDPTMEASA